MAATKDVELSEMRTSDVESEHAPLEGRKEDHSKSSDEACVKGTVITALVAAVLALIVAIASATAIRVALEQAPWNDGMENRVLVTTSPVSPSDYVMVEALHGGSGEWVQKRWMPFRASDLASVVVRRPKVYAEDVSQEEILLLGGLTSPPHNTSVRSISSSVVSFDPVTEQFNMSRASMLTPRYRFGAGAVHRRFVLVAGGYSEEDGPALKSTMVYDSVLDVWASGPDLSIERGDLTVAVVQDTVVVIGGYGVDYDMSTSGTLVEILQVDHDDEWTSMKTGTWTTGASMPTSRGDLTSAVDEEHGLVFVVGGWNEEHGFLDTVEMYDVTADRWTSLPPMPSARGDKATVIYQGSLMAIGGEIHSGRHQPCPWEPTDLCAINEIPAHDVESVHVATLEETDTPDAVWVNRARLPESVFRLTAQHTHDAVWVFGGETSDNVPHGGVWAFFDTFHAPLYAHILEEEYEEHQELHHDHDHHQGEDEDDDHEDHDDEDDE